MSDIFPENTLTILSVSHSIAALFLERSLEKGNDIEIPSLNSVIKSTKNIDKKQKKKK